MSLDVAHEILRQLGGHRFIAMTSATQFVGGEDGLRFRIPTTRKINVIDITLDPDDTYTIRFFKVRGCDIRKIEEYGNVYANQLQDIFTHVTGLDTNLGDVIRNIPLTHTQRP